MNNLVHSVLSSHFEKGTTNAKLNYVKTANGRVVVNYLY